MPGLTQDAGINKEGEEGRKEGSEIRELRKSGSARAAGCSCGGFAPLTHSLLPSSFLYLLFVDLI